MTSSRTTSSSSPASSTRAASPARPSGWACPSRPSRGGWRRSRPISASGCCCARRASSPSPTSGTAVLAHAHHVVEDVEAAESLAQNRQTEPSGRLRVSMPNDLANLVLAPMLAEFVAALSEDRARSRPVRALRRPGRRELRRGDPHGRAARRRHARGPRASRRSAGASTRRRPTSPGAARRPSPRRSWSTTRCAC